jgi:hypothetical protein
MIHCFAERGDFIVGKVDSYREELNLSTCREPAQENLNALECFFSPLLLSCITVRFLLYSSSCYSLLVVLHSFSWEERFVRDCLSTQTRHFSYDQRNRQEGLLWRIFKKVSTKRIPLLPFSLKRLELSRSP